MPSTNYSMGASASKRMSKALGLCAMLIALASAPVLHAATITVSVTSGGGGDFFGDGAITSATLAAADGDVIELIEGGTYTNGNQTITLDGSKSLTFRSTTSKWGALLLKNDGGSPYFQLEADAGDVTYTFDNIQIINNRPTRGGEPLTFRQHTTNTMTLVVSNCRFEGNEGIRFEGPQFSETDSAPISITLEDSEFLGHSNNAFSTGSWGGNEPHQNITMTATNCLFSADDGTGFATPGEEENGNNAVIWQSNRPMLNNSITFENCDLISNQNTWTMNGNAAGELQNNDFTFINCNFTTRNGNSNGVFRCDYGHTGNQNNTFLFDRCSLITTSGSAQTRTMRINIGDENETTPTTRAEVSVFNSIIMSAGSTTSTLSAVPSNSTPVFLEGQIDAVFYHNNIGHRDAGLDASGYGMRFNLASYSTIDFQNNIIYNLGGTAGGATTDTIIRLEGGGPILTEDSNLIIGTTNSTTLVTNSQFEQVADPVEGADIGEDFLTLVAGASATAIGNANTPGAGAVATAVGAVDRLNNPRYLDDPDSTGWEIGAYEIEAVPVELGTFSLE